MIPHSLKAHVGKVNAMLELNYIECGTNGLQFTNPDINYMFEKHDQFIRDIMGKDIDFGIFSGLITQLKDAANKKRK